MSDIETCPVFVSNAQDLLAKTFEPLVEIVPGYLVEGVTILAGRAKVGKSWLALNIALGVARDGNCSLGPCSQGDVLFLSLEDSERRLRDRIKKLLGGAEPPAQLHYSTNWPRIDQAGLKAISDWVAKANNPKLVVIDVLEKFRPLDAGRTYQQDYIALGELQALAQSARIAIVINTHLVKAKPGIDPLEAVSGRVYMNPPFSRDKISLFIDKLLEELRKGNVKEAICLTNSYTDTQWFHNLARQSSAICFPQKRIRFIGLRADDASPPFGQAFTYFGRGVSRFKQQFGPIGLVVVPS